MGRYRITAEFDLEIADEEKARALGERFVFELSLQQVANGGGVVGDSDAVVSNPAAVASMVAVTALDAGIKQIDFAKVSHLTVQHRLLD